jgi:hypothetical protein
MIVASMIENEIMRRLIGEFGPVWALPTVIALSCPINNLLDPPADFRAGQGAPTSHSGLKGTGEEARQDAAQRVSY